MTNGEKCVCDKYDNETVNTYRKETNMANIHKLS